MLRLEVMLSGGVSLSECWDSGLLVDLFWQGYGTVPLHVVKSGIFCGVSELLAYHGWSRATQDFGAAPQLLTMDANALGLSKKLATHGGPYNMMVFLGGQL